MVWLSDVITWRVEQAFQAQGEGGDPPPDRSGGYSEDLLGAGPDSLDERLIICLSLAPFLTPDCLDPFLIPNTTLGRPFSVFGGELGKNGAFLPTVETALFLVAGTDIATRHRVIESLSAQAALRARRLITIAAGGAETGFLQSLLKPGPALAKSVLPSELHDSADLAGLPAHRLTTPLKMDDLVLTNAARAGVDEMLTWIRYQDELMNDWGLSKRIPPGYRSLFHGPPGTGKTLTATLLGQAADRDVLRIDLSQIVSKWIGETEKNLSQLFAHAEAQGWILFFDEADALFGKRTSTQSSNDRYANLEVSYLLQRLETFSGIAVLASNLKGNIDTAFLRRFQSVIFFAPPGPDDRLQLWQKMLEPPVAVAEDVNLAALAKEAELSGGAINNVIRRASILAKGSGGSAIDMASLRRAIRMEMHKEGQIV